MLVFAAPDAETIASAFDEARRYLGWKSIVEDADAEILPLDSGQSRQAVRSRDDASNALDQRVRDAYRWLLVPEQQGAEPMRWNPIALTGGSLGADRSLAVRVSQKLTTDGLLVHGSWSPILLKKELDTWIWKDGEPHVNLKRVWEYLATYPYFTRLRDVNVLRTAVEAGVRSGEYFGYADGMEETRYRGLVFGRQPSNILFDDVSLLVRAEIAAPLVKPDIDPVPNVDERDEGGGEVVSPVVALIRQPTRFFGTVKLNANRLSSSAGQIGEEIVQHLNALAGADVEIVLEIHARSPEGIPDQIVRIVSENASTLKFEQFGFEED